MAGRRYDKRLVCKQFSVGAEKGDDKISKASRPVRRQS